MKFLITVLVILGSTSFANAKLDCRFASNGQDMGMGLSVGADGCMISNGYTYALYSATVVQSNDSTVFHCSNKFQNSYYAQILTVTVRNGRGLVESADNRFRDYDVSCK